MNPAALHLGAEVAFTRGGTRLVGEVVRVGERVIDVEVPVQVVDAGFSTLVAVPMRVRLADATLTLLEDGHPVPLDATGMPLPLCGHAPMQRGCGGCDPGTIEYVRDDGEQGWRKVS